MAAIEFMKDFRSKGFTMHRRRKIRNIKAVKKIFYKMIERPIEKKKFRPNVEEMKAEMVIFKEL